jgi:hypothetical protein
LLSHSTTDHFELDYKISISTPKKTLLLRAMSDTSYKLKERKKSGSEEQLKIEIQIETTKEGISI